MAGARDPSKAAQWLTCVLNAGLLAGAVGVVAAEGLDLDRDGASTAREAALVLVRLLAFPVHVPPQIAPAPALWLLGVPAAPWPPSAAVALAPGLPLWGALVCGVLVLEAWLGMAWAAVGRHPHHAEKARTAERRRPGVIRTPPAIAGDLRITVSPRRRCVPPWRQARQWQREACAAPNSVGCPVSSAVRASSSSATA